MLIAVLSFIPGNRLPKIEWDFISIDTLVHFAFYFVLAVAMILGGFSSKMNLSQNRLYLIVLLVGIAYGTSIELIQGFYIYQRFFDTADILANLIGTVFAGLLMKLTGIKLVQTAR